MNSFFNKKNISYFLWFSLLLYTECTSQYSSRICKLINIIAKQKICQPAQLNNTSYHPPTTDDLFEHGKAYSIVSHNEATLRYSMHHFWNTPGYFKSLKTFISTLETPNTAKGHLYTIQRAAALHKAYPNYDIIAFNTHCPLPTLSVAREFDIVMQHKHKSHLIVCFECKACNLEKAAPHLSNGKTLCTQFLEQKEITDKHNLLLQVSSYQPLNATWRAWFNSNMIHYFEGVEEVSGNVSQSFESLVQATNY